MDSEATPTPWEEIDGQVFGADGFEIADPTQGPHLSKDYEALRPGAHWATTPDSHVERTEEEEKANAALIVRAVNAHDDLVAVVAGLLTEDIGTRGCFPTNPDNFQCEFCAAEHAAYDRIPHRPDCLVVRARAALAKAGER